MTTNLGIGGEWQVADFVDLCRARHKSTYAEPGTMPTAVVSAVTVARPGWASLVRAE
ncbi:MAG: hypothetical protein ACLPVY_25580 [Acidimicrobiia bacterium]